MTEPAGGGARAGRRPVAVVAALVLVGAAACAGAAALTWWTAEYVDPLTGPLTLTATGADCLPELVPVALVALAGFGACLATQGWVRRLVGVILLAGGLLVAIRAAIAMGGAPVTLTSGLVRPADPAGPAELHVVGPILALVGGVLLAVAGGLVAAGRGGRRRLGSRYEAPAAASTRGSGPASDDPSDWWKALDAGTDPTDPAAANRPPQGGYHDDSKRAR